jgi:hypothetical protein
MKNPWTKLQKNSPYILREDLNAIKEFNKKAKKEHKIKHNILPQPFIGSPKTAKVILLSLNPGYSPKDKYAEDHVKGFKQANLQSYNFKNKFAFYLLDDRFKNTSAYNWWYKHLKEVIKVWGIKRLGKELLCIEFFPYHSLRFKYSRKLKTLSQDFTLWLVKQAMLKNQHIVIMRSARLWHSQVKGIKVYKHKTILLNPQNPCVTPSNMVHGRFKAVFQSK